jgi:hypothetical protein
MGQVPGLWTTRVAGGLRPRQLQGISDLTHAASHTPDVPPSSFSFKCTGLGTIRTFEREGFMAAQTGLRALPSSSGYFFFRILSRPSRLPCPSESALSQAITSANTYG